MRVEENDFNEGELLLSAEDASPDLLRRGVAVFIAVFFRT